MSSSTSPTAHAQRACAWVAFFLACLALPALAQVRPPPLPAGSAMVNVQGGMDLSETARQTRAHHHKLHYNKDYMHDDTQDTPPAAAPANVQSTAASYAPQAPARALSAPAQAALPCPVQVAAPTRAPTSGDLAGMQPRPGDLAALGTAARPASAASATTAGCLTTAPRVAAPASRPAATLSSLPAATTNSRSTK